MSKIEIDGRPARTQALDLFEGQGQGDDNAVKRILNGRTGVYRDILSNLYLEYSNSKKKSPSSAETLNYKKAIAVMTLESEIQTAKRNGKTSIEIDKYADYESDAIAQASDIHTSKVNAEIKAIQTREQAKLSAENDRYEAMERMKEERIEQQERAQEEKKEAEKAREKADKVRKAKEKADSEKRAEENLRRTDPYQYALNSYAKEHFGWGTNEREPKKGVEARRRVDAFIKENKLSVDLTPSKLQVRFDNADVAYGEAHIAKAALAVINKQRDSIELNKAEHARVKEMRKDDVSIAMASLFGELPNSKRLILDRDSLGIATVRQKVGEIVAPYATKYLEANHAGREAIMAELYLRCKNEPSTSNEVFSNAIGVLTYAGRLHDNKTVTRMTSTGQYLGFQDKALLQAKAAYEKLQPEATPLLAEHKEAPAKEASAKETTKAVAKTNSTKAAADPEVTEKSVADAAPAPKAKPAKGGGNGGVFVKAENIDKALDDDILLALTKDIKFGDRDAQAGGVNQKFQEGAMQVYGGLKYGADGIVGKNTIAIAKRLQADYGLEQTGVIDKQTIAVLQIAEAKKLAEVLTKGGKELTAEQSAELKAELGDISTMQQANIALPEKAQQQLAALVKNLDGKVKAGEGANPDNGSGLYAALKTIKEGMSKA